MKNTRVNARRSSSRGIAGLVVAIGVVGMIGLLTPSQAQDLVRADFVAPLAENEVAFIHDDAGIEADDESKETFCGTGDGVPFNYVDGTDADCTPPDLTDPDLISNVSKGGRWHLKNLNSTSRSIKLTFPPEVTGGGVDDTTAECAALANLTVAKGCTCGGSCDAKIWISADRLFKNKATRQALGGRFDAFEPGQGPVWRVNWIDPLYLCDDPDHANNNDWRVMQSVNCTGEVGSDVSLAEIVRTSDNASIGEWHLPIQIRTQRVSPADDGGSDPPPPASGCLGGAANGTCEAGETCNNCADCDGKLNGKPSNRFCCGDGDVDLPTEDGPLCDDNP